MAINNVTLSGNVTTKDLRTTKNGMSVLSFGIAVNKRVKGADGEWTDKPNFFNCLMFGKRADSVDRFIDKGSKVAVKGELSYSSWEDNGHKRSKVDIIVDEIEFMSRKKEAGEPNMQGQFYAAPTQDSFSAMNFDPAPQQNSFSVYDENIPF